MTDTPDDLPSPDEFRRKTAILIADTQHLTTIRDHTCDGATLPRRNPILNSSTNGNKAESNTAGYQ